MPGLPLLFLDFDGVICDSVNECIFSSSVAYFELYKKKKQLSLPSDFKTRFTRLRPYIRNGEDYLVVHEMIEKNISIADQSGFDAVLDQYSDALPDFKKLFYTARTEITLHDRDFWFSLNRIYPHVYPLLGNACSTPFFRILSTKRPDFIMTILQKNKIDIDAEKIFDSSGKKKLELISSVLDAEKASGAVFVDDQIDHLRLNKDPRIVPYLASWGYVMTEWFSRAEEEGISVLDETGMEVLLDRYR